MSNPQSVPDKRSELLVMVITTLEESGNDANPIFIVFILTLKIIPDIFLYKMIASKWIFIQTVKSDWQNDEKE